MRLPHLFTTSQAHTGTICLLSSPKRISVPAPISFQSFHFCPASHLLLPSQGLCSSKYCFYLLPHPFSTSRMLSHQLRNTICHILQPQKTTAFILHPGHANSLISLSSVTASRGLLHSRSPLHLLILYFSKLVELWKVHK